MLKLHFYSIKISLDETRQECHEETVTEMVTETITEQQCTGKLISISVMKKKLLNHILILS